MRESIKYLDNKINILYESEIQDPTIITLFKPLFIKHEEHIRTILTEKYNTERKSFINRFPANSLPKENVLDYIKQEILLDKYPDKEKEILDGLKEIKEFEKNTYNLNFKDRQSKKEELAKKKLQFESNFKVIDSFNYIETYRTFLINIYDNAKFEAKVIKIINDTIAYNEAKLISAIQNKLVGLHIKSVSEIYSRISRQGIEGAFKITLDNDVTGTMETHSIEAGGWNIQILHYRYLINLSDSLKEQPKTVTELSPDELRVAQTIAKYLSDSFTPDEQYESGMKIQNDMLKAVEHLKGSSRNWSPFINKKYIFKIEYGNYYLKRYNYYITKEGFDFFKTFKGQEPAPESVSIKLGTKQKILLDVFNETLSRYKSMGENGDVMNSPKEQKEYDTYKEFFKKYPFFKRDEMKQHIINGDINFEIFNILDQIINNKEHMPYYYKIAKEYFNNPRNKNK